MVEFGNEAGGFRHQPVNGAFTMLRCDDKAFYDPLRDWIMGHHIGARALKAGDPAPEFLLPDQSGQLVSSRKMLAAGPLVLSFFGGSWCPYCARRLQDVSEAIAQFRTQRVRHCALTPETGGYPRRTKELHGLDLSLLADVDSGVGLSFGVIFVVPASIDKMMRERGIDLGKMQGVPAPMLSLPATYVIAASGTIFSAQIDCDYAGSVDVGPVVEAVRTVAIA